MGNKATATCFVYSPKWERKSFAISLTDVTEGTVMALPPEGVKNIPKINTVIMGPIKQREIKPKLSSSDVLSARMDANPSPKAMTKGTIIGPVVTPPDSQAMERKLLPVKQESTKAIE